MVTTVQPPKPADDLALVPIENGSAELQTTSAMAKAQAEIQSSILIAKKFPRNEENCFAKLMRACDRFNFADAAAYAFPRGGTTVTGPSVQLAREAGRVWGNMRFGLRVLRDTDKDRLIQGWAWDLESNAYVEAEDEFEKLIQRKRDGKTVWVEPDERDIRELTNRRGAILIRNCILSIVPKDLIEDALERCVRTIKNGAKSDPDMWKKILTAFGDLNIGGDQLTQFLGHPVKEASPEELARLRQIYQSIAQGNSVWSEYIDTTPNGKAAQAYASADNALEEKLRKQRQEEETRQAKLRTQNSGENNDGDSTPEAPKQNAAPVGTMAGPPVDAASPALDFEDQQEDAPRQRRRPAPAEKRERY